MHNDMALKHQCQLARTECNPQPAAYKMVGPPLLAATHGKLRYISSVSVCAAALIICPCQQNCQSVIQDHPKPNQSPIAQSTGPSPISQHPELHLISLIYVTAAFSSGGGHTLGPTVQACSWHLLSSGQQAISPLSAHTERHAQKKVWAADTMLV